LEPEGRLDLELDEVLVSARWPVPPPVQPHRPDDDQDGVALGDRLDYRGAEILARPDSRDITEYLVLADVRGQPVVEPPDGVRRLGPSIADEDPGGTGVASLT
jgi:hypothetical protein